MVFLRKILVILELVAVFLIFSKSVALAQVVSLSNFDKVYQTYISSVEVYKISHSEYVLARAQYLRYRSLTSQEGAQVKTIEMLRKRDEVVISYLKAIKERLRESVGVEQITKNDLSVRIDEDIGWFSDHQNRVSSAVTLKDLVKDSDEAEKRFEGVMPLFYEVLSTVSLGLLTDYDDRLTNQLVGIRSKVESISKDERGEYQLDLRKMQLIEKWIFESESRMLRSAEKRSESQEMISDIRGLKKVTLRSYDNIIIKISEVRQHLKEAVTFMTEILREVKTVS